MPCEDTMTLLKLLTGFPYSFNTYELRILFDLGRLISLFFHSSQHACGYLICHVLRCLYLFGHDSRHLTLTVKIAFHGLST